MSFMWEIFPAKVESDNKSGDLGKVSNFPPPPLPLHAPRLSHKLREPNTYIDVDIIYIYICVCISPGLSLVKKLQVPRAYCTIK